jgi:predicted RNase H-like nuclease
LKPQKIRRKKHQDMAIAMDQVAIVTNLSNKKSKERALMENIRALSL